ncbi:hypothetical protein VUR80DRAFT_9018 [Thermomyces stellatus]
MLRLTQEPTVESQRFYRRAGTEATLAQGLLAQPFAVSLARNPMPPTNETRLSRRCVSTWRREMPLRRPIRSMQQGSNGDLRPATAPKRAFCRACDKDGGALPLREADPLWVIESRTIPQFHRRSVKKRGQRPPSFQKVEAVRGAEDSPVLLRAIL